MIRRKFHHREVALDLSKDDATERLIEARAAIRAEHEAVRWRFRLILIETVMIASTVLAAGIALDQPTTLVVRGALIVGAGCFLSGTFLIGLSGITGLLLSRYRRWRAK